MNLASAVLNPKRDAAETNPPHFSQLCEMGLFGFPLGAIILRGASIDDAG
jgi:hypothetical protein